MSDLSFIVSLAYQQLLSRGWAFSGSEGFSPSGPHAEAAQARAYLFFRDPLQGANVCVRVSMCVCLCV